MAKIKFDGKEYEIPNSEDWTTGELSEAEHALGRAFGENSKGDDMTISFYIAVRRVVPSSEIPDVVLADRVKQTKLGALSTEEEDESPPVDAGMTPASQDDQQTTGRRLSAASG